MKNLKTLLVATLLGLVLITGNPAGVAANNSTNSSLGLDAYDRTIPDFHLSIDTVGPNVLENAELQADGTYHIVSDSFFTLVRVRISLSGFTMINNGTDDLYYGGQLFLILNGEVNVLGSSYVGSAGVDIPLDAPVNVVTFLYVGYMDNSLGGEGYRYVSDTVVIRTGDSAEDMLNSPVEMVDNVPVTVTATESANSSLLFDAAEIISSNWNTGLSKNKLVEPSFDLNIGFVDSEGTVFNATTHNTLFSDATLEKDGSGASISVAGTYNTSGFLGEQAKGLNYTRAIEMYYMSFGTYTSLTDAEKLIYHGNSTHPTAPGLAFWYDANGLTPLDEVEYAALFTGETFNAQSQFGVVAISPSGTWDHDQDLFGGGIDWDGLASNAMYGTVDFGINAVGLTLSSQATPDTIIITSTTEVNSTVNIDETATSTVEEGPGFSTAIAMTGVAVLAYITPRLRKKDE